MTTRRRARWLLGLAAVLAPAALAQTGAAAIANYEGPDRAQRVLEGARKEGTLTVYTSAAPDDIAALTGAFEKAHGVKVRVWRASSENVLRRVAAEARGGRFEVDVVETNGPELEFLHREKLLQAVRSPHLAVLIPEALLPHREWIGTRLNVFTAAYNTRLVRKEELPRTWADLLDPKWKGKLGIEAQDLDWFAGVIGELGEPQGLKLFRELVATNGLSVRKGHTLLTNLVVSGEVPVALTVYSYKVEQLKRQGAPIDWFVVPPAIARPNGVAVARRAPHPHAAVLFFDFMLSDAQRILAERHFVPTAKALGTPLGGTPLKLVDPRVVLDEGAKWSRLYDEIIARPAR